MLDGAAGFHSAVSSSGLPVQLRQSLIHLLSDLPTFYQSQDIIHYAVKDIYNVFMLQNRPDIPKEAVE
jgi:hypothetical protein